MHKLSIFVTVLFVLFICSCRSHSPYWETLLDIESYMESRPDSALSVIESMDVTQLSTDEERAKYSLLYSMALDKNYVDRTDFEVLAPAIKYYEKHGSKTDKLRTFYYEGRIYKNIYNKASAMTSYIKALEKGGESDDLLTKARLYVQQGHIYSSLRRLEDANNAYMMAAENFLRTDRISSYVHCLLRVCSNYEQEEDIDNTKEYLDMCQPFLDRVSDMVLGVYYSSKLIYLNEFDDYEAIKTTLEEYQEVVTEENIDYLSVSSSYLKLGYPQKAIDVIINRDYTHNLDDYMRWYTVLMFAYEKMSDYEQAYYYTNKFYRLYDEYTLSLFDQDTQFIEERHSLEVKALKEKKSKWMIFSICFGVILLMISLLVYIHWKLKYTKTQESIAESRAEHYRMISEQLEEEKESLVSLLSKHNDVDEDAKSVVLFYIDTLSKYYRGDDPKVLEELIRGKESFLSSVRSLYSIIYPNFIKYLTEKGLSDIEIKYCCLYAIGVTGKDVNLFLGTSNHYKIGVVIRQKLGLNEKDMYLVNYIKKLINSKNEKGNSV